MVNKNLWKIPTLFLDSFPEEGNKKVVETSNLMYPVKFTVAKQHKDKIKISVIDYKIRFRSALKVVWFWNLFGESLRLNWAKKTLLDFQGIFLFQRWIIQASKERVFPHFLREHRIHFTPKSSKNTFLLYTMALYIFQNFPNGFLVIRWIVISFQILKNPFHMKLLNPKINEK